MLWFADIRGFTPIADAWSGPIVIDLLDGVFETLAASLRPRGGQVLKFLGDGMLSILPFEPQSQRETCRHALDAAAETMAALEALNLGRREAGKPTTTVDLACTAVLYGNVGAADRLDFTVIGPAVTRSRALKLYASLSAARCWYRRISLQLPPITAGSSCSAATRCAVREAREIFALLLEESATAASSHSIVRQDIIETEFGVPSTMRP